MPLPSCAAGPKKPSPAAAGATTSAAAERRNTRVFMPRLRGHGAERSLDLDQERVALPTAGADRREAETAAVPAQLVDHRAENAPTARADGVAECNGAAVHVRDIRVSAEHLHRVDGDGRERLVHLDTLDLADRLARLRERLQSRVRRRAREPRELVGDVALRDDRGERLETAALRELLRADDEARGAVVDAGRVTGGDRPLG